MRQIANNTFNDGLLMDMQPLTTPNTVLTDCLNGTLITYDGNEFVLQSDDGNGKIVNCKLPKDFIPLGMKEYGGIVYIVSQNPFTGECEIGSFPSPESVIFSGTNVEQDPQTIISNRDLIDPKGGLKTSALKIDFGDLDSGLLRPGDKFAIYLTDSTGANNNFLESTAYKNFENLLEVYNKGNLITRNLYKLKLVRISEDGVSESIKEIVPAFSKTTGKFYYNKSQIAETNGNLPVNPEGFYAVYNNKIDGYLAVILELEQVDEFNLNIGNIIPKKNTSGDIIAYGFNISMNSISNSKNNIYGADVIYSEIDQDGKNIGSNKYLYPRIDPIYETTWNGWTIAKPIIKLEQQLENLNADNNVKITVSPYSKFNWFHNLKYENILNYNKLTSAQESKIWKYYLDTSLDTEVKLDKMLISFDFFVRGTLNGRNKLDAMYIEFYDVIADTSLFYPFSSISDSKTISIDCFNNLPVLYTATGGLESDINSNVTDPYYLLINKNKSNAYGLALKDIDKGLSTGYPVLKSMASNPWDKDKKIPDVYELKSRFNTNTRFNSLGSELKSKYNKLRRDNFYIVAVCGLDFYEDQNNIQKTMTYVSYNFMWTNGIFNKYWQLSEESDNNFNLKQYPDFLNIGFSKISSQSSEWIEDLKVGELSSDHTSDIDPLKSFQSYIVPVSDIIDTNLRFDTRVNINGTIKNDYKVTITKDESKISYGKLDIGIVDIPRPESTTRPVDASEIVIKEKNNTTLTTESKVNNISIYNNSSESTWNPLNGLSIKFSLQSNRKINDSGYIKNLNAPDYTYSQFKDLYNIDIIKTTNSLTTRTQANDKSRCFYVELLSEFIEEHDYDTYFKNKTPIAFDSDGFEQVFYEAINKISPNNDFMFIHLENGGHDNVHSGYAYTNYVPGTTPPGAPPSYNSYVFLVIRNRYGFGLLKSPYLFIPIKYACVSNDNYKGLITAFNNLIKTDFYFRSVDNTLTKPFWTPNTGLLEYHNDFNTIFNFDSPILNVNIKNAGIQTWYKKTSPKILNRDFYNDIKNIVQSEEDVEIIGQLFNKKNITPLDGNLPYQKTEIINSPINLKDTFTLKNNLFILNKDNIKYTIGNIVEELQNPQKYVESNLSNKDSQGNQIFNTTLLVKNPNNNEDYVDSGFTFENNSINYGPSSLLEDLGKRMIAVYDQRDNNSSGSKRNQTPLFKTAAKSNFKNGVFNKLTSLGNYSTSPFE